MRNPYTSSYAPTIASLIQRQGESRARTLRDVANVQAQAAATKGEAWGRGIEQIGQIASRTLGQVADWKATEPQRKLAELETSERLKAVADRTALEDALKQARGDYSSAIRVLETAGQVGAATLARQQQTQMWDAQVKRAIDGYKVQEHHYDELGRIFGALETADDQQAATLYRGFQPRLRELAEELFPGASRVFAEMPIPTIGSRSFSQAVDRPATATGAPGRTLGRVGQPVSAPSMPDLAGWWGQVKPHLAPLREFVSTEAQRTQRLQQATNQAQEERLQAKHQQEIDEWALKWLPKFVAEIPDDLAPEFAQGAQEQWTNTLEAFKERGVSDEILKLIPQEFSPEAKASIIRIGQGKEPLTSIDAAILAADRKGDTKERQRLMGLKRMMADAGRAPGEGPQDVSGAVETIMDNPSIWSDVTPSMRDKLLVPLGKAGFNFTSAARSLSDSQKAQIERWRTNAISRLNEQRRDPSNPNMYSSSRLPNPEAEALYKSELDRIEQSYRMQLGTTAPSTTPPPAGWRGAAPARGRGAAPARGLAPTSSRAPTGAPKPVVPGNIDLFARPAVKNADGTTSTVRSMSFEEDGREVLIPTVVGDSVVSDEEAIAEYRRTGQHLGIFATAEDATAYAKQLHEEYAAGKYDKPQADRATRERVRQPAKVGEIVVVKGQRIRVTKVNPDGTYEGEAVR
jgi:hypothetical protein